MRGGPDVVGLAAAGGRSGASGAAAEALERMLSRATGTLCGAIGVMIAASSLGSPVPWDTQLWSTLTGALLLVVCAGSWMRWPPIPVSLIALASTVVGEFGHDATNHRVPAAATYAVMVMVLLVCARLAPRPAVAITAVGVLVYVLCAIPDSSDLLYRLDMQVLTVGMTFAAVGFIAHLRRSAAATDAVAARIREETVEREAELAESRTLADTRRLIHDDVVGTLALFVQHELPAEDVRARAREAVAKLEAARP